MSFIKKPIIPVLFGIALALSFLVFIHFLQIERTPVADGWSREFDLSLSSKNNNKPFVIKKDDRFQVISSNGNEIQKISSTDDYKIMEEEPLQLNASKEFVPWTDGEQYIYMDSNHHLLQYIDGATKQLADGVSGFVSTPNVIAFWTKDKLYSIDPADGSSKVITRTNKEINRVLINGESILMIDHTQQEFNGTLFQKKDNGYEATSVFQLNTEKMNQTYTNFQYILEDNVLNLMYTKYSLSNRSHEAYYLSGNVKEVRSLEPKHIAFYPEGDTVRVDSPNHLNLSIVNGKLTVLFSAQARVSSFKQETNIFKAVLSEGKWEAEQLTRTMNRSNYPFLVGNDHVMWKEATSGTSMENLTYKLMGITTNKSAISASKAISLNDMEIAASHTGLALSMAFITFLIAMTWIAPSGVFLLTMFMFKTNSIESGENWVLYTAFGLYFVTQITLLQFQMNERFYMVAPSYLTFKESSIIVPVIGAIVSIIVMKAFHLSKEEMLKKFGYTIAINILILTLLIGPYRF